MVVVGVVLLRAAPFEHFRAMVEVQAVSLHVLEKEQRSEVLVVVNREVGAEVALDVVVEIDLPIYFYSVQYGASVAESGG